MTIKRFFPLWIAAALFFFLFTTFGNTAEYRPLRRPATTAPKQKPAERRSTHTEASSVSDHKFNVRGNFDVLNSFLSLDLDIGLFQDNLTVGPSVSIRSVDAVVTKFSFLLIGVRANYYLNHNRYTNGIIIAPTIGLQTFSMSPTLTTVKSTSGLFAKVMGIYQYWVTGQGVDGLNLNGGLGFALFSGATITIPSLAPGILPDTNTTFGPNGFSPVLEIGIGYSF